MAEVIVPIIHNNGTRKSVLLKSYTEAYGSLNQAWDRLSECPPNERDYYLQEGLFSKACEQHSKMLKSISDAMNTIEGIYMGIDEQETNDK